VTTVELDVSGADLSDLRRELALVSSEQRVDIAVAPAGLARRGRRLVVMDVDSTLIQDEVIELLARHAGREALVAEVTEAGHARRARLRREPARNGWRPWRGCPARCSMTVRDADHGSPRVRGPCVRTLQAARVQHRGWSPAGLPRSSSMSPPNWASTTCAPTGLRSSTGRSPASVLGDSRRPRG
jgi:hypothetical protein